MPDSKRGGGAGTAPPRAPPPPHPQPPTATLSIVDNVGAYTSHCGYCEAPGETAASVGMWAHALAPATYGALVDAGWRRSGRWVYRPLPTAAVGGDGDGGGHARPPCCVAHTIRLDVRAAVPSRAQRRCLARMAAFLAGGPLPPPTAGGGSGRGGRPATANGALAGASPPTTAAAWAAAGPPPPAGTPALVLPLPRAAAEPDGGQPSSPPRCPSPRGVSPVVGGVGGAAREPPSFAWPPTTRRRAAEEGQGGGGSAGGARAVPAAPPHEGGDEGGPVDAAALAARLLREAVPAPAMGGSDRKRKAGDPPAAGGGGSPAPPTAAAASPARAAVAAALSAAATALLGGGSAADVPPPSLPLAPPKAGTARRLPPTVALACPAGPVLAAHLSRAGGGGGRGGGGGPAATTPAALATALAVALAGGGGLPPGWSVTAEGGHLNFHAPSPDAAAAERGGPGRGGRPAPSTATAAAAAAAAQAPLRAVRSRRSWPSLADAAAAPPPPSSASPPQRGPGGAAQPPPAAPARRRALEVVTVRLPRPSPAETDALIAAEFPLFARYQASQHGDDPAGLTPAAFKRFLVDTPLVPAGGGDGAPSPLAPGSAHQQYWLDGALIAVGVVDVLPRGLSSVYFFWEPGLGGLGLGRWSALQEIAWVKAATVAGAAQRAAPPAAAAAAATAAAFRYYYMGYYIHTCPKMRYKAEFAPSELLAIADGEVVGRGSGGGGGDGGGDGSARTPKPTPGDPAVWPPPPLVWVPAADAVRLLDADPRADLRVLAAGGGGGGGAHALPPPRTLPSVGPPLAPLPAVLQTLVFAGSERGSAGGGGSDAPAAAAAARPRTATTVTRLGRLAAAGGLSRPALAGLVDRLRPWVAAIVAAGVEDEVVVLV